MWQWSIFWCHNQAAPNISKHFFVLFSPVYVLPQWSHSHLLLSCTSACFLTFSHFHIVEMGAMQEPQEPHFFPPLLLCCFCCRCQDVSSKLDDDSRSSPLIVWWVGQMKIFFWSTNYCQQTINDIIVRPCGDDIDGSKLWRHDLECPWDSICVQENPTGLVLAPAPQRYKFSCVSGIHRGKQVVQNVLLFAIPVVLKAAITAEIPKTSEWRWSLAIKMAINILGLQ